MPVKSLDRDQSLWQTAQEYELSHAVAWMEINHASSFAPYFSQGGPPEGYIDDLYLNEFFGGSLARWSTFCANMSGKVCMDIGPCTFSPLASIKNIKKLVVIEPLGERITAWQRGKFGWSSFDGMELRSVGAHQFIDEYRGAITGAIWCRNMLDHSPYWPFILSNIASYAAQGAQLVFWTDLDHRGHADDGHFDICSDVSAFERLLINLGFQIDSTLHAVERPELNWGCVATKVR